MLDFYRRVWGRFLIACPALAGVAYLFREYHIAFKGLLITASICGVVALIGFYRDYKDSRQKAREQKRDEDRKALRESVKRLNPEYTEEQIDWWIDKK